jgi:hypothetical protein
VLVTACVCYHVSPLIVLSQIKEERSRAFTSRAFTSRAFTSVSNVCARLFLASSLTDKDRITNAHDHASTKKQAQSSPIPLHTQTLIEQLSSFANPPAETTTTMDKDMTASSPPSKAPTSPGLEAHTGDSNDQPSLMSPSKTKSGADAEHSDAGSAGTPPDDTAANVLEVPAENAAARSNKRARAKPLEEDSLPSPKRVAKGSTPPQKKATAKTGRARARACDTCKRRKVSECVSNHTLLS